MPARDPHSFADLDQGTIRHVDFDFDVDFEARNVRGRSRYRLDRKRRGPFDLDTRDLEVTAIRRGPDALAWDLGPEVPILGRRLRIDDLGGADAFEIDFRTRPTARALHWLAPQPTGGAGPPPALPPTHGR